MFIIDDLRLFFFFLSGSRKYTGYKQRKRKDKRLFTAEGDGEKIQAFQASDERDEGRWIAGEIEKLHSKGTSYDDIAVF